VKLEFEDATWQVEPMDVDMVQGEKIAAYTGLSILAWYQSLLDADKPVWNKSIRCLYWLMREQNPHNGATAAGPDALNFQPMRLLAAFQSAVEAEAAEVAAVAEDPTLPGAGNGAADSTPPLTPAG
jgi:hypothetical protein